MEDLIRSIKTIRSARKTLFWLQSKSRTERNEKQIEIMQLGIQAYITGTKLFKT